MPGGEAGARSGDAPGEAAAGAGAVAGGTRTGAAAGSEPRGAAVVPGGIRTGAAGAVPGDPEAEPQPKPCPEEPEPDPFPQDPEPIPSSPGPAAHVMPARLRPERRRGPGGVTLHSPARALQAGAAGN